mmetsp:Transcript_1849/g.2969  ORF Transcript_1849/g.2969 Transcript_1849/m.2969 type:complete len:85 (+) Transcript_1849:221-475(+)
MDWDDERERLDGLLVAWRHVDGTNDHELYDMFHRMEQNNLDEVVHKVEAVNRVEVVNIDLTVIEAWVRVDDIHEQGGYLANQTI